MTHHISNLDVVAIASCRKAHFHDPLPIRFTYAKHNPLAVRMHVAHLRIELSREVFFMAICEGHMNGCNIIGEGDVTYKVLRSEPELLSISWLAPPEKQTEDSDRFYLFVKRQELYTWLQSTYVWVPKHAEVDCLEIDNVIAKIMEGSK